MNMNTGLESSNVVSKSISDNLYDRQADTKNRWKYFIRNIEPAIYLGLIRRSACSPQIADGK